MKLVSVILAAGKGTRMKSDLPKVLHPLNGAPILEHVLDACAALHPDCQVVVVGYGHEKVESSFEGREISWAHQTDQRTPLFPFVMHEIVIHQEFQLPQILILQNHLYLPNKFFPYLVNTAIEFVFLILCNS